ncbi:MAG: rRNA pseudouridine synthase [Spirochaetales bacterium]|nr:rRNA pseudouridine synthase [Candidatus Physcosoma equi]
MENESMFPMRLQAYMAKCGVASRRGSEELIAQGRVMVNNKVIREQGFKVTEEDIVQVDQETIELPTQLYYIALNKPKGYVCTNFDPNETKYARDLIGMRDANLLFNVGRLDKESNGLILFTNDGNFANAMMHPRYEVEKEYIVKLNRNIEFDDLNKALDGIYIDLPQPYKIKRYDLMPRTKSFVRVTLTEGKNREIRKIFNYLDYDVKSLTRIRIGNVELGEMQPGEWRNLKQEEIAGLFSGKNNSRDINPKKVRQGAKKVVAIKKRSED